MNKSDWVKLSSVLVEDKIKRLRQEIAEIAAAILRLKERKDFSSLVWKQHKSIRLKEILAELRSLKLQ